MRQGRMRRGGWRRRRSRKGRSGRMKRRRRIMGTRASVPNIIMAINVIIMKPN